MKFLKYALIIFVVALITDATIVLAGVPTVGITHELDGVNVKKTSYYEKDTWTTQKYSNKTASTWLTDPCTSCQIGAKPGTSSGDLGSGVVTITGQTKSFTDPTSLSSPGTYRLSIWRVDATLLSTYHTAIWTLN